MLLPFWWVTGRTAVQQGKWGTTSMASHKPFFKDRCNIVLFCERLTTLDFVYFLCGYDLVGTMCSVSINE